MKKLFGLCAVAALITGGVVLSNDASSTVDQSVSTDAIQAVESAVNDSDAKTIQEDALPEEEAVPNDQAEAAPEQSQKPVLTPSESVEEALQDLSPAPQVEQPSTPYILGVIASPVPPMVRAHVTLAEGSGLLVQTIKPNGPAANAGVLPYDIIVSIDGIAVNSTNDLSAQIQKAAGKPQKLTILRQGKELTLDVTAQPAEASHQPHSLMFGNPVFPTPQPFFDPSDQNFDTDEDDNDPAFPRIQSFMQRQRQQMEQMRQRVEAMENAMRQGMPGFFPFPGNVPVPAPDPNGALTLPPQQLNNPNAQVQSDSFSVQVQKNGNEPAIIKIQENGNEYIVDENSLDQLPENVRNRLNFKIQTNDK